LPQSITLPVLAFSHAVIGEYDKSLYYSVAVQAYYSTSRGLPPNPMFDIDIAKCYLSLGDNDKALIYIERGLMNNRDYQVVNYMTQKQLLQLKEESKLLLKERGSRK
jgi:tetratricopeptide (TPR) repeat protein